MWHRLDHTFKHLPSACVSLVLPLASLLDMSTRMTITLGCHWNETSGVPCGQVGWMTLQRKIGQNFDETWMRQRERDVKLEQRMFPHDCTKYEKTKQPNFKVTSPSYCSYISLPRDLGEAVWDEYQSFLKCMRHPGCARHLRNSCTKGGGTKSKWNAANNLKDCDKVKLN